MAGDAPRSGASHGNSVVQVIGLPSVKIVHGALLSWQPTCLRFPRYLHQTIIVATGKRNVLDERLPKLLPITSFCILATHISSSVLCIRDHPFYFLSSIVPIPLLPGSFTTLFSLSLSRSFLCFYYIRDCRKISKFVINALWVFIQIHFFFFLDHNEYFNLINSYILCVFLYLRIFNFRVNT